MMALLEEKKINPLVIAAFRGSAKSTLVSLCYVLWAVMGKPQKKHILLVSRTQEQARQLLRHLRVEMEQDGLLHEDLGPFHDESGEWRNSVLILSKWNARIVAISVEQSIRGTRHSSHRPDLIIFDDIEDIESVKTREGRDKTWEWVTGEAIPAGDTDTRVILIGNHLHNDSVLQRYRKRIKDTGYGVYKAYPFLDGEGNCLWQERFPTAEDIEAVKRQVPDEIAYRREFLLEIVVPEDQVVRREWIQRYDQSILPVKMDPYSVYTGVDPAASEKDSSDYTGIVSMLLLDDENGLKAYVLPEVINKRMNIDEIRTTVKRRSLDLGSGSKTKVFTEEGGQQAWLTQLLRKDQVRVEGVSVGRMDKRERLGLLVQAIRSGKILFPKEGVNRQADHLIDQMTGFGTEKHDDLMDAFSLVGNKVLPKLEGRTMGVAAYNPHASKEQMTEMDMTLQDMNLFSQMLKDYTNYDREFRKVTGGVPAFASRY